MDILGLSALELSRHCGISNSLISRWRGGQRPFTPGPAALEDLVSALLERDSGRELDETLAPFRTAGESREEALRLYLTGQDLPALPARDAPPEIQRTGEYTAETRVLLGSRGFRRAGLLMLDHLLNLPPGREVVLCVHGSFSLWHASLPFALQVMAGLNKAVKRGARFLLVNRLADGLEGSPWFSVLWLTLHMRGVLRSRHYEGDPPPEAYVAVISGYWSGRVERDDTAEDKLISTFSTDPRSVRRDEAHCETYIQRSIPVSQYGFLQNPGGRPGDRLWRPGPLPAWQGAKGLPSGNFCAICRVPCFGVMTQEEFTQVCGEMLPPPLPDFLFPGDGRFAPGPHRIILCREDVREGLQKARRVSEPLGELLHRKVYVPRDILAAGLGRLLAAMAENEAFEVALMPRSAFEKLELELVHWHGSAAVGWLQDGSGSMYDHAEATARSFAMAVDHTWSRLQKGWKRRRNVMATLRKWLAGRELDVQPEDSAIVQNWELVPKE